LIAFNAVTALSLLIVDLSLWIADTAHSVDQVISRQAAASSDNRIPNFIDFAWAVADSIGRIINLSWWAKSTRISNKIITFFADAFTVDIDFISIAGRGAKSKIFNVS